MAILLRDLLFRDTAGVTDNTPALADAQVSTGRRSALSTGWGDMIPQDPKQLRRHIKIFYLFKPLSLESLRS
jgi:hypothetical protein